MSSEPLYKPLLIYKIACLLSGALSIVLGYLLFQHGISEQTASLEASKDTYKMALTAGPGIFFALFGSAVIGVTIYRGFTLQNTGAALQDADPTTHHEYEVVKHYFDKACLCISDAHKKGKLTDNEYERFNECAALLMAAINDMVKPRTPQRSQEVGIASAPGH